MSKENKSVIKGIVRFAALLIAISFGVSFVKEYKDKKHQEELELRAEIAQIRQTTLTRDTPRLVFDLVPGQSTPTIEQPRHKRKWGFWDTPVCVDYAVNKFIVGTECPGTEDDEWIDGDPQTLSVIAKDQPVRVVFYAEFSSQGIEISKQAPVSTITITPGNSVTVIVAETGLLNFEWEVTAGGCAVVIPTTSAQQPVFLLKNPLRPPVIPTQMVVCPRKTFTLHDIGKLPRGFIGFNIHAYDQQTLLRVTGVY